MIGTRGPGTPAQTKIGEVTSVVCAEAEHGSKSRSHAVSLRSATFGDRLPGEPFGEENQPWQTARDPPHQSFWLTNRRRSAVVWTSKLRRNHEETAPSREGDRRGISAERKFVVRVFGSAFGTPRIPILRESRQTQNPFGLRKPSGSARWQRGSIRAREWGPIRRLNRGRACREPPAGSIAPIPADLPDCRSWPVSSRTRTEGFGELRKFARSVLNITPNHWSRPELCGNVPPGRRSCLG